MKNLFVVDSKYGPYKLIQEAIDASTPGSNIKIAKGIYHENLIIKKDGLRLQPRDEMGDIIIVASKNPCISVNLKKGQKLIIEGLKIAHCGNNDGTTFFLMIQNKYQISQIKKKVYKKEKWIHFKLPFSKQILQ